MATAAVRVRLFASLRELTGTSELELVAPTSVESCWTQLCELYPGLEAWRNSVRPALNLAYTSWGAQVAPGDELAFLPPVSGGASSTSAPTQVRVGPEPIDIEELTASIQRHGIGAIATFVGLVRDPDQGRPVLRLVYEAYPEMVEPQLAVIAAEARQQFGASQILVQHRTGPVEAGVASVAVLVGAAHRHQALDACAYVIDELKSRVPIWKVTE
jgi:molybdopterin synthase catalytic subunit